MQKLTQGNRPTQLLIIIVIIALIVALFIWKYFDYKIIQLKMESTHLMPTEIVR